MSSSADASELEQLLWVACEPESERGRLIVEVAASLHKLKVSPATQARTIEMLDGITDLSTLKGRIARIETVLRQSLECYLNQLPLEGSHGFVRLK